MRLEKKELYELGFQCGKIARDIVKLVGKNLEKVLFVTPLRGGLPIFRGVSYGISRLLGSFEADVLFLAASSIVEDREGSISRVITKTLKKKEYKSIIITDEAISGSSSKMVLDSVKDGVKNYREDKDWKRFYWKHVQIYLFDVVAYKGIKFDPRIRKLRNVMIYPVNGKIITTDNDEIYPIEYPNVIKEVKSKDGKKYRVVSPDILFVEKPKWKRILKLIERGVEKYFESERREI